MTEKQNLTVGEGKALNQLRNNRNIVTKPADKGNAMVLMGKKDYLWEVMRQLKVTEHYSPLDEPIYQN